MITKKDIFAATKEIREFNPKDQTNPLAIAAQTDAPMFYAFQIRNDLQHAINTNDFSSVFNRVLLLATFAEAHRIANVNQKTKNIPRV